MTSSKAVPFIITAFVIIGIVILVVWLWQYYSEGVRRGGTLIAVRTNESNAGRIADIMGSHGAVDINKRGADYRTNGYTGYNPNAQPMTAAEVIEERHKYRSNAGSEIVMPPFSGHRL